MVDHGIDPDHAMIERLITYVKPDDDVLQVLEQLREDFKNIAHFLVDMAPRTPERTLAIRAIHRACQESIFAVIVDARQGV